MAQETIPGKQWQASNGGEQEEAEKPPLSWLGYAEEARRDGIAQARGAGAPGNASYWKAPASLLSLPGLIDEFSTLQYVLQVGPGAQTMPSRSPGSWKPSGRHKRAILRRFSPA